jgi:NADP-dependent 3-hydroxy acid dehydrogenase YdfG
MNIVITGASRGIGLAEAKRFDTPDNQLFLVASSDDSFKHPFKNATTISADLSTVEGVSTAAAEITARTHTVDVLINNVGVMVLKKFEELSEDDINLLLNTNLRSHLLLTKALLAVLYNSSNPQIVFMSSMAAKSSIIGESVYSATKGGVTAFANVLRNELAGKVRVSTVHAWGVNTWSAPEPNDLMEPEDIAEAVDFIISRPASVMVESIDLSNPVQWRGSQAPWSPQ